MSQRVNRRQFMGAGWAAGGVLAGATVSAVAAGDQAPGPEYPWPYRTLDVAAVKERAYRSNARGGCMFGVFEAVAGSVADQLGKPYTDFPFAMAAYGGSGVAGWGTLCGTCNGAAMAIALFHQGQARAALTHDVFSWYEATALPVYVPASPGRLPASFVMPASRADSVLCHVSISKWSGASGLATASSERAERCARLVADVAGYLATALNKARGDYAPARTISDAAAGCLTCHGKPAPKQPGAVTRMSCPTCHDTAHHQDGK